MTIHKILSWVAVVIWMILIFNLSSQVAEESNQLSTGITEAIARTIEKVVPNVEIDTGSFNHIVRKNAHFFAYFVLGILVMNAFRRSVVYGYKSTVLAAAGCVLYAVSDEIHQLFVPGRGGQVKDVIIDSAGAGASSIIYLLVSRTVKRKKA